jgi:hypothetical protein
LDPARRAVPIGSTSQFATENYVGLLRDSLFFVRLDIGVW